MRADLRPIRRARPTPERIDPFTVLGHCALCQSSAGLVVGKRHRGLICSVCGGRVDVPVTRRAWR